MLTTNIEGEGGENKNPTSSFNSYEANNPVTISRQIFASSPNCSNSSPQIISILYNHPKTLVPAAVGG